MPYNSSGLALIQSWGYELVFIKASFVGDTVVMPARCAHEGVKRTARQLILNHCHANEWLNELNKITGWDIHDAAVRQRR